MIENRERKRSDVRGSECVYNTQKSQRWHNDKYTTGFNSLKAKLNRVNNFNAHDYGEKVSNGV